MQSGIRITLLAIALSLTACSTQTAKGNASGNIPPSSPLARIRPGQPQKDVLYALGAPTDERSYATGKACIPFYMSDDAWQRCWCYRNLGRVVLSDGNFFGSGGGSVLWVEYDPKEPGKAR